MNVVGVIPARYKSTRFPGKPLADILGKPMIYHVYQASAKASLLDRVVVATDDERITDACDQLGADANGEPKSAAPGPDGGPAPAVGLFGLGGAEPSVEILFGWPGRISRHGRVAPRSSPPDPASDYAAPEPENRAHHRERP